MLTILREIWAFISAVFERMDKIHMGLIAALEEEFDIMMDTEDIIEFGSYTVGIEKLKKYGVDISA